MSASPAHSDPQLSLPLPDPAAPLTAAPRGEETGRVRRVLLGGQPCHFRLRRARRRTIGFQIDDHGLTVSAPRWVSLRAIEEAIVEKERWIRNKLAQWQDWRIRKTPKAQRFVDGAQLAYLGQELTLRLGAADERTAALRSGLHPAQELHLAMPPGADEAEVRLAVQTWYVKQAILILGERVQWLATRGGLRPFSWKLSSARTQWGSCNEDRRIRLNWRLLFFPIPVIDYVVAHELAHLAELNHGPRFWREVERLMPDFQAARSRIKDEELAALPL
jgi:predicted metal-dependent hydrolase